MASCEKCARKRSRMYKSMNGRIICMDCGHALPLPKARQVPLGQDDGDFILESIRQNDPGHARLRSFKRDCAIVILSLIGVIVLMLAFA